MNNSYLQNDLRLIRRQLAVIESNTGTGGGRQDVNITDIDGNPVSTDFGYSDTGTILVNFPIDNTLAQSEYYFPKMDQIYRFPYYYTDFRDISNQFLYEELNRVFDDVNVNLDNTEPRVYGTGFKISNKLVSTNPASVDWYSNWTIPDTLCHFFVTFRLMKRVSSLINTMTLEFGVKQVRMANTNTGEGAYCFSLSGSTWAVKNDNVSVANSSWNVDKCNGNPGLENRSQIDLPTLDDNYPLRYGVEFNRFTKQMAYYIESPLDSSWVLVHRTEVSNPKSMKPFIRFNDPATQAGTYGIFFSELTVQLCTDPSEVFQQYALTKTIADIAVAPGNYAYPLCSRLRFTEEPAGNRAIILKSVQLQLDATLAALSNSIRVDVLYIDDYFDNLGVTGTYAETGTQDIACLTTGEQVTTASLTLEPVASTLLKSVIVQGADLVTVDLSDIKTARLFGNDTLLDNIGNKQQSAILIRVLNTDPTDSAIIINYALTWSEY